MASSTALPTGLQKLTERRGEKLLVSRHEAAYRLSISRRALDYLIADGTIKVRRIGSRVLIPKQVLLKFAATDHPRRLAG